MADKQIIIDGIDVSGCEHLYREIDCLAHIDFSECCEGYNPSYGYCPNTDCYYKRLKRKEQECEELKNFHINLVGVKECEIKELVKLKQTLTEIKEIANKFDYWNSNLSQASETLHEIIERISECEGNDE